MTLEDLMEILELEFANEDGPITPGSPITKTLKVNNGKTFRDIDCIIQDKDNIYLEIKGD